MTRDRIASRANDDRAEAIDLIERALAEYLMGAEASPLVRQVLVREMSAWLHRVKPDSTFCSICRGVHGREVQHDCE